MRLTILTTAALAASSLAASAADLPMRSAPPVYIPPPIAAFSWTGFYAGVNGGYAFSGSNSGLYTVANGGAPFYSLALGGPKLSGGFGGGQIGYNYQLSQLVLGVEADAEGAAISANNNVTAVFAAPTLVNVQTRNRVSVFGSVRGRIGYTFDRFLVYATGGYAYADVHASRAVLYTDGFNSFGSRSDLRSGYAIGGGVEYAFSPNWTVKAEYLYYDLGSKTLTSPEFTAAGTATTFTNSARTSTRFSSVKVGVNYKFDMLAPTPVVARY